MKTLFRIVLLLGLTLHCSAQINIQKSSGGVISNGPIIVGSGNSFTGAAGATIDFSLSTLSLPSTQAIPSLSGQSGKVLSNNGSVLTWITGGGGGGSGTVTAFSAGNLAPLFTTSVANSTTTPALTFALSTQSPNLVYAGPVSGSAAAPTFRALVAGDFPASGVSAGTYGDSTHVSQVAIDASGRVTSATSVSISGSGGAVNGEIGFGADGSGSVVTTGFRVKRVMEYACTITGWGIVADQSGSIVMDIRKGTPSGGTVTTSTITGSATPSLTSQQVATSTTLTGWTTAVAAGDVLELVVTGTPATLTFATITLKITRP